MYSYIESLGLSHDFGESQGWKLLCPSCVTAADSNEVFPLPTIFPCKYVVSSKFIANFSAFA